MSTFNMTCEAVEATLPDYLDETLEAWVRSPVDEHLGQCLRCAGLVRDLRNIEREAAALPDLVPVRDLWPEIENRIGTPVVAFAPAAIAATESAPDFSPVSDIAPTPDISPAPRVSAAPDISPRGRRLVPAWMAVAAAALVVVTAGTTYLLTSRAVREDAPRNLATTAATITNPAVIVEPESGGGESDPVAENPDSSEPRTTEPGTRAPAPGARPAASLASRSATEAVYNKEIVMLQAIMRWRRAELDPATAAIIDKNLRIIDAAIAQSKAALRRDPASAMLTDQLSHALDKKVELLRTAAMLPTT